MTPRPRVASVARAETADAVIELARTHRATRASPSIDEDIDDIVGVVHVKQAVAVPRERRAQVPVSALQSEALRVPETMKLDTLLGELRGRGFQMAVVVDEYGGTAGVATLEDLVEELVGEVADEHDRSRADVVRSRNWLTFPGALRPDELLERADVLGARGRTVRDGRRLDHERARPASPWSATPSRSTPGSSGSSAWTAAASTASGSRRPPSRSGATETGEVAR